MLKIPSDEAKAIVHLDSAPLHPIISMLYSQDGKIWCCALPPNTSSLIQPMDQTVIYACKRTYKKKFLHDVMVVIKTSDSEEGGIKG
jgi:hypothetical protein